MIIVSDTVVKDVGNPNLVPGVYNFYLMGR